MALSTNKLKNIFSRYLDNENLEGLYFRNDSHEWETKLRIKTTNYLSDWKISWGGNIQYSDYYNNTVDFYNQIEYLSKINFPTTLPKLLPTTDTSKLCVNRVWTKLVFEKGTTWVLSCSDLKNEEKTILS